MVNLILVVRPLVKLYGYTKPKCVFYNDQPCMAILLWCVDNLLCTLSARNQMDAQGDRKNKCPDHVREACLVK